MRDWALIAVFACAGAAQTPVATRFAQNPLVSVGTSKSLGDNVNGPSVIRVPSWLAHPLGRYYMYFAHHKGDHIRLAYANAITGPWKIYEPGVLQVRDTIFYRPQPDPPTSPPTLYTHVASPEVYIDDADKRLVMYVHGMWTDGKPWPVEPRAAVQWIRDNHYAQYTQTAVSADGLHFEAQPASPRRRRTCARSAGTAICTAWRGSACCSSAKRAAGSVRTRAQSFRRRTFCAPRPACRGASARRETVRVLFSDRRSAREDHVVDHRAEQRLAHLESVARNRGTGAAREIRMRGSSRRTFESRRVGRQRERAARSGSLRRKRQDLLVLHGLRRTRRRRSGRHFPALQVITAPACRTAPGF